MREFVRVVPGHRQGAVFGSFSPARIAQLVVSGVVVHDTIPERLSVVRALGQLRGHEDVLSVEK